MSGFDLRSVVRDAIESAASADPSDIAAAIASTVASAHLRAALRQALPALVTQEVTSHRNRAMSRLPSDEMSQRRSRWAEAAGVLNERLFLPGGGWKFMREATRDDLLAVVQQKRTLAAGLIENAEKFEALASVMAERKLAVLGDLSEDEIRGVLAA